MKRTGNTIIVTRGGSGIGAALAQRFHDRGNTVIVAGRREEALLATITGRADMHALTIDVGNEEGVADAARRLLDAYPTLNVLINNAGIMREEALDRMRDLTAAETMIATNLLGPIRLTNALVDHLTKQPDAAIVNVTSGTAFVPFHPTATYSATKAALHSYTLSLREALCGRVEVIEIIPPAVQTDLTSALENSARYEPLPKFADEVMAAFDDDPVPHEILVARSRYLRTAEAEGRFDETMAQVNAPASARAR